MTTRKILRVFTKNKTRSETLQLERKYKKMFPNLKVYSQRYEGEYDFFVVEPLKSIYYCNQRYFDNSSDFFEFVPTFNKVFLGDILCTNTEKT